MRENALIVQRPEDTGVPYSKGKREMYGSGSVMESCSNPDPGGGGHPRSAQLAQLFQKRAATPKNFVLQRVANTQIHYKIPIQRESSRKFYKPEPEKDRGHLTHLKDFAPV
jgi:hypothetical protein